MDDLLDVSRISSGKMRISRERVRLDEVIVKAVEMVRPTIDVRGHRVELKLGTELWVDGDEQRLAQVIANVVGNAAKFTPAGGSIVVAATRVESNAVLVVEDDGVGMPANLITRVFQPFVQGAVDAERSHGGLGLGLAIAREIVELHSGTIDAQSDGEGRGTRVRITLPLAEAPQALARAPRVARTNDTSRRVLVVDDNEDNAETLRAVLESVGHVVWTANDATSALETARTDPPDVAILDIGLPGMNGYELAHEIRRTPTLATVRLVALSGYGQPADRRNAEEAGFEMLLVKPVDIDRVRAVVSGKP